MDAKLVFQRMSRVSHTGVPDRTYRASAVVGRSELGRQCSDRHLTSDDILVWHGPIGLTARGARYTAREGVPPRLEEASPVFSCPFWSLSTANHAASLVSHARRPPNVSETPSILVMRHLTGPSPLLHMRRMRAFALMIGGHRVTGASGYPGIMC